VLELVSAFAHLIIWEIYHDIEILSFDIRIFNVGYVSSIDFTFLSGWIVGHVETNFFIFYA
jgi:hypothetical protein